MEPAAVQLHLAPVLEHARARSDAGHDKHAGALTATVPKVYTSMCEPMMTVRSRGRPKYSAASAVM
ncbi:hypothetical protein ABIC27_000892 [Streptomyces sp. PvR034]